MGLYELESKIMSCWNVTEDIDALFQHVLETSEPVDKDQVANVLLGLKELYNIKFQLLFDKYEELLRSKK